MQFAGNAGDLSIVEIVDAAAGSDVSFPRRTSRREATFYSICPAGFPLALLHVCPVEDGM